MTDDNFTCLPLCTNNNKEKIDMRKQLIFMVTLIGLLVAISTFKVQAQVVGEIEADIPFPFYAGNAKFVPGKYILKMMDNSDLMEISSADGSHSAVFQVRDAQAATDTPKTELFFNK